MPEYLSPGVYLQEVNSGPRPIEGVGTAMAAFVGFAPAGPENWPTLITSWTQYVETFGRLDADGRRNPHIENAFLSHAVYGYFLNGGGRCYVTRVVSAKAARPAPQPLQVPTTKSEAVFALKLVAKGVPTQDIQVEIAPPAGDEPAEGSFTLRVRAGSEPPETFENVTMTPKGGRSVREVVNQGSRLIEVAEAQATGAVADRLPKPGLYTLPAPQPLAATTVSSADLVGQPDERTGVAGMEIAESATMICCPDLMAGFQQGWLTREDVKAVQLAMIAHCEHMQDRIAILDPLPDLKPQEVLKWRMRETSYNSMFAALYYPWLEVANPLAGNGSPRTLRIPPCGHMAGIYARNDNQRGVHKAPANETVQGVLNLVTEITKGEHDMLNPEGINCIRTFAGRGVTVWGARTLSADPAWRYLNVRRLFNYVEKSVERGLQWVVFEPNDYDLWARVKRDITAFLTVCWREGMLFGLSPDEAFFVKCDAELNPPASRDLGRLYIDVGLAPVKPAEFVIIRFSQKVEAGA